MRYTLTDYTFKYRSDSEPEVAWGVDEIRLTALRNEMTACQLLVEPDQESLLMLGDSARLNWRPQPSLRIQVGKLRDAEDRPCPGAEVEAFFVGTVPVGDGVRVGDPLLRDGTLSVPAGQVQPLWLSLRVPASAQPGPYNLDLSIFHREADFADEELVGRATVWLEVTPLALPESRDFRFHLDLWQHPANIARTHGVPLWSEEHWRLIEAYGRELARLGQKSITVIGSDSPWAGQRCRRDVDYPSNLHEYNYVRIRRGGDGGLAFDFSALDRYIETYMGLGIDGEIEVLGLLAAWDEDFGQPLKDHPDNIRLSCYDEGTGRIIWLRRGEELATYLRALGDHLKARGWWGITRFSADEPADVNLFRQRLDFLHAVLPEARIKVACNHPEFMAEFLDEVADWVPILGGLARDPEVSLHLRDTVQARGDRFLWYVCCWPPRPNTFITSPLLESRFLGWFTAHFGLDGFLRWAFTCWPADPWRRPAFRSPHWPPGDMFLVYPGQDGRPVRSLRTELLLLGIQDFELIALAREVARADSTVAEALDRAFARVIRADLTAFADTAEADPETLYSLDPADYEAARREVLRALLAR